jgi:hypothetical protein
VVHYLPCFGEWLLPTHSWPSCLSSICSLIVHAEISSLLLPLFLIRLQHSHPLCCCARLQFAVCCSGWFFLEGSSLPRGCVGLSQGWLGEFCSMGGTHLFGLSNVLQAGLELVAVLEALKFSQCKVLWESFPQSSGSGCQRFDSGWCFISA